MTELDVNELKQEVKVAEWMEPHFAIKVALLLLAELVLAVYKGIQVLSKIEKKVI